MLTYKKEVYKIEFVIEDDKYVALAQGEFNVTTEYDGVFEENDSQVEVTKFEKLDDNFEFTKKDLEELLDYGGIEYDLVQDSIAINANVLQ